MGYLTTITLYNDALHKFEEHPKEFAETIFKGIEQANRKRAETSVPFHCYGNYISIQPSRHADDRTVYFHHGNGVLNVGDCSPEFEHMSPSEALDLIDMAIKHLIEAKDTVKRDQLIKVRKP
jgi:hypothetical protein